MDKKEKSLSDLVSEVFYNNCCKSKLCKNCKYNTTNYHCHIINILEIIRDYEKENIIYEKNNKNQ